MKRRDHAIGQTPRWDPADLGPQYSRDHGFRRRARLLQSYWRAIVLGAEMGQYQGKRYGNFLRDGKATGDNFLSKEIFHYALFRVVCKRPEETIDEERLFNNMLSSQPMCFNFFFPLRCAAMDGEPFLAEALRKSFPYVPIKNVTSVEIEYVPTPTDDYLGDKTAFDALVEYEAAGGGTGIIGIETKYTDELGKASVRDNPMMAKMAARSGIFTSKAMKSIAVLGKLQVHRNLLLAEAYRLKHGLRYSHSIILAPRGEPGTPKEVAKARLALKTEMRDRIQAVALDDFVGHVREGAPPSYRKWIEDFQSRYLNFAAVGS